LANAATSDILDQIAIFNNERSTEMPTPIRKLHAACWFMLVYIGGGAMLYADEAEAAPPLFDGLGSHSRTVTANVAEAQQYFNQGLAFLYAFNHDEAERSFKHAAELDPACGMAYWGIAISQGPHINNPVVPPERVKTAVQAISKAQEARQCTAMERAMIEALSKRYVDPQPEDRKPLDEAYAAAMADLWKRYPDDADVGALYAESLMDLHPWDLWTVDAQPQDWTPQVLEILEAVLKKSPDHPLALHLYIHATEASATPARADDAADRLRRLAPGLGHLVHMPTHIDIRRGRWADAVKSNELAIAADRAYAQRVPRQEFYRLYMAHNHHMLAFAAMMQGQSKRSLTEIRTMLDDIPAEWLAQKENAAMVDFFFAAPYEVLTRFGRWHDILAEREPTELFPIARAIRHFARSTALGALGKLSEARDAQKAFREAVKAAPPDGRAGNNPAADLFAVADATLEGELFAHEGKMPEAIASLRLAAEREDKLRYDEPPDWIQPVRHALGAVLMTAGKPSEAEAAYREDLQRWPDNGWSLFGLAESLAAQGKHDEAAKVREKFNTAWKHADVTLSSSCFCQCRNR
jgi:tetratricopeptide (TPR) repeat protein